jgi:hypothetical protein
MNLLKRYLIASNDNRLLDQPYDDTKDELSIHTNRIEDWYVCRRITTLFPYFDQRGALHSKKPTQKRQGKSTFKQVDVALDAKFRKLLGLE